MTITKKIVLVIIISALVISAFLFCDAFNIMTLLWEGSVEFQWDLQAIVIGNVVVIAIFITTYILIESNNIKRQNNQEKSAKIILETIYENCKSMIASLDNVYTRERAAQRMNGDVPVHQDPVIKHCQDAPFEYKQYLFEASNGGILAEKEFKSFLQISQKYKEFVVLRLAFFDAEKYDDGLPIQKEMKALIATRRQELLRMLDDASVDLK